MFAQKVNLVYNKINHMVQRKYIPKYLMYKAGFLSGTARIFDLHCVLYKNRSFNQNFEKEDYESILSDWMVTGQDIENAIVQLEKTI